MKRILGFVACLSTLVIIAQPLAAQTNWTGAASSDWYSGANWDNGAPFSSVDTTISAAVANQPTITSGQATARALVIGKNTSGSLTVSNGATLAALSLNLGTAAGGNGRLTLASGGTLNLASGTGTATLGGFVTAVGTLNIGASEGSAADAPGLFRGVAVSASSVGLGTLNFNHTSTNYVFSPDGADLNLPVHITGATIVRHNAGVTTLVGGNSYTGGTTVNGGTLTLIGGGSSPTGTGAVTVNGGRFGGDARVEGNLLALGGTIAPGTAQNGSGTLEVGQNLVWSNLATFEFNLGQGVNSSRVVVGGQLAKQSSTSFRFDFKNTGTNGTFTLMTFGSTDFVAADFNYVNIGAGLAGTFSIVNNTLQFTITGGSGGNTGNGGGPGAPTVTIGPPSLTATGNDPFAYTITYTDSDLDVVTLSQADITLNTTGTAQASVVVSGGGSTRVVTILNPSGVGTLGISIAAGTARDLAGHLAPAVGPSATVTVNNAGPVITSAAVASGTYGAAFGYTITADLPSTFAATGLPPGVVYDGSTGVISGTPTVAGTFNATVAATDNQGRTGTKSVTITVAPKPITLVGISVISKTYDGNTSATLNTSAVTLDGVLFNDVGNVALVATGATAAFVDANAGNGKAVTVAGLTLSGAAAANYTIAPLALTGNITGTPVAVTLSNLSQTYDGSPKPVTVITVPSGLALSVTYNGSTTVPTDAGPYAVVAVVTTPTYGGSATSTLLIAKASQTISFAALPDRVVTDPAFGLSASASSGLPVTFSATGPAFVSNNLVFLSGAEGSVTVTATQGGSTNYTAVSTSRTFSVRSRPVPGAYFGTFAGDRSDAAFGLLLRSDNTGVFFGFLPNRGIGLQTKAITVDQTGVFSATFTPIGSAPAVTLRGSVASDGSLTGSIDALGVTFSGTNSGQVPGPPMAAPPEDQTPVGSVQAAAAYLGLYKLSITGTSGTTVINVLTGPDGRTYVFSTDGVRASGGAATVQGNGTLSVTLSDQSQLALVFASNGVAEGTLTPSGGTAQRVVGGADGVAGVERMINMSARGRTNAGNATLISGFVVRGDAPKRLLVRVAGPILTNFDVANVLPNPTLTIFNGQQAAVATNDDWGNPTPANPDIANQMASSGAFNFGANSRDSAIVVKLAPGAYTVHAGGGDGVVLTEVYELLEPGEPAAARKIVNFSARGQVGIAGEPLTAGFNITGPLPKRVLVRGIGPTISSSGLPVISNPRVRVYRGQTVVKENDDWFRDAEAAQISAAATSVGAFALNAQGLDAALIVLLEPGSYTAIVDNVGGGSGIALVEVYELP